MADPQINPNALGAPTEGFGQTVSFAFDPRGVTPALSIPKSEPRGFGVSGAGYDRGSNPNEAFQPIKSDGTSEFLQSVGKEILAPMIEKERNTKFMQGVQRSMQGEAVKDIATEQPWYSRIFGDTPMLEGARAYEANTRVNKIVAEETANIEKIKHLGSDEAAKHYADVVQGSMTGDTSTDMLVNKGLLDAMPHLMKAQAKSYYAYGQKRAADALSSNIASGASALQEAGQLHADDKISEDDFAMRGKMFIRSIMPPEGINEENYGKTLSANIKQMAANGQFHAIEAIRKSGGFGALTPEQTTVVEASITASANKARNNYAFNYVREIAELKSDAAHPVPGMTPHAISDRITAMNTAFRKLTGSPVGLFTSDEAADMVNGTFNAIKAEDAKAAAHAAVLADRTATAEAKTAAAAALAALVEKHVALGQTLYATHMPGVSSDMVDNTFMALFRSNPAAGTDLVRKGFVESAYVNPLLKAELTAPLRNSEGQDVPANGWRMAVQQYRQLREGGPGSTALAAAYFGEYAPKLEKFIRMTEGAPDGSLDPRAYREAMGLDGKDKPQPLDKKARADLLKSVVSQTTSVLPKWLGGDGMRPDQQQYVAELSAEAVEDWRGVPGMSDSEAVAQGVAGALSGRRIERMGSYVIDRATVDHKLPTLREMASKGQVEVTADKVDAYFDAFLASKHVGTGLVRLHYSGQDGDVSKFQGTVLHDGHTEFVTFTSKEWQAFAGTHTLADTSPTRQTWYRFGTPLTYPAIPPKGTEGYERARRAVAEETAEREAKSRARLAKQQPK